MPALAPSFLFKKRTTLWFFKACFLSILLEKKKKSLFPHPMTSLIWVICESSELFIFVNCNSSRERANSRSCILLQSLCLQLHSKEDDSAGMKPALSQMFLKLQFGRGNLSAAAPCSAHTLFIQHLHEKERARLGCQGQAWEFVEKLFSAYAWGITYENPDVITAYKKHLY